LRYWVFLLSILNTSFHILFAANLILLVAGCFTALGQQSNRVDSTTVYPLPAITVTSSWVGPELFQTPFSFSNISLSDSVSIKNILLEDVIASSGGNLIKDYGGVSGIKTISQRGLGSEHTLFLLNGMRISSFENGLVDLGVLPLDGADRVVVTNGGQSAEYGPDAVGGSVNIVHAQNFGELPHARITSAFGSFGTSRYHVSGGAAMNHTAIVEAGLGVERSSGEFPFLFHNGNLATSVTRQDADIVSQFGHARASLLLDPASSLSIFSTYYSSDRGSPGPVTSKSSFSRARQIDDDGVVQAGFTQSFSERNALNVSAQVHYTYERYNDPDLVIANVPLNDYFKNIDLRATGRFADSFESGKYQFTAGVDAARTTAEGNSIAGSFSRNEAGVFATGVFNFLIENSVFAIISLFPALRADFIESSLSVVSPQLGALLKFNTTDFGFIREFQSAIRTNVSRNFRMPTFNELYYAIGGGIGNPYLEPEHSTSYDAGTDIAFILGGEHVLKLTYFFIDMENRITWVPAGGLNVTPENLRHVQSDGLEANYQWHSNGELLMLEMNYSLNNARKISEDYPHDATIDKQLIYVPEEVGNISLGITKYFDAVVIRSLGMAFKTQYTGFRYTNEDNSSFLPSFYVSSLVCHGRIDIGEFKTRFKFESRNIFGKDYQIVQSYPMPMRSYQFTFELEY
jgi:vitamin B12 transporter